MILSLSHEKSIAELCVLCKSRNLQQLIKAHARVHFAIKVNLVMCISNIGRFSRRDIAIQAEHAGRMNTKEAYFLSIVTTTEACEECGNIR
jgi:hypothetical protein